MMAITHEGESIEGTLLNIIVGSELVEGALSEVAELSLDNFLDEGILQDLPVVSTLKGLWKTGKNVRDLLFLKKLVSFLAELGKLAPKKRKEMVARLEQDPSYAQRVGESLILLLDRLDHSSKPTLVAKAFRAYCLGAIDSVQLQKCNQVIDRAFMPDLVALESKCRELGEAPSSIPRQLMPGLVECGLAWSKDSRATSETAPTEIFAPFVEHVLLNDN